MNEEINQKSVKCEFAVNAKIYCLFTQRFGRNVARCRNGLLAQYWKAVGCSGIWAGLHVTEDIVCLSVCLSQILLFHDRKTGRPKWCITVGCREQAKHVQISSAVGTGLVVNAAAVNNNCICGIIVVCGLFENKTTSGEDQKPYT